MFIVFGKGGGQAVMGDFPEGQCPACGQRTVRTAVVVYKYAHLWYLFSFLTGRDYRTVCRGCGAVAPLDKADARAGFPRENIPFMKRNGWMAGVAIIAAVVIFGLVANQMSAERLRALLDTPAVGDVYMADLSKIPNSGYRDDEGRMYGAMMLLEKLDDGRFVVATSDVAYNKKSGLRKEMRKGALKYSVSGDDSGPLTLSREDLARLHSQGVLYDGERGSAAEEGGAAEGKA